MENGGNASWWRVLGLKNVVDILFVGGAFLCFDDWDYNGGIGSFSEQGRPIRLRLRAGPCAVRAFCLNMIMPIGRSFNPHCFFISSIC